MFSCATVCTQVFIITVKLGTFKGVVLVTAALYTILVVTQWIIIRLAVDPWFNVWIPSSDGSGS